VKGAVEMASRMVRRTSTGRESRVAGAVVADDIALHSCGCVYAGDEVKVKKKRTGLDDEGGRTGAGGSTS
jgi:hypothetical protein